MMVAAFACACGPTAQNGDDTGSGDDDGTMADAPTPPPPGDGDPNAAMCSQMDLLFVIDNSGSMGQEQTNLIANFATFIDVLDQSGLDYRVAVTTTARNYSYNVVTPFG